MTIVALRTADFAPRQRVEQFKAAASHICKLDIVPEAGSDYRSETVIGVLPGAVITETTHAACRTKRDHGLAAETVDNLLIHIPRSGAFRMKQTGGEDVVCGAGDVCRRAGRPTLRSLPRPPAAAWRTPRRLRSPDRADIRCWCSTRFAGSRATAPAPKAPSVRSASSAPDGASIEAFAVILPSLSYTPL